MGEQLDLFIGRSVALLRFDGTEEPVVDAPPLDVSTPADDPRQMNLFGDRWLRATAAQTALERFDLDAACAALREHLSKYPDDRSLAARARVIESLAAALRDASATATSHAEALLAIANRVPDTLTRAWHLRIAEELESRGGSLGDIPAGLHWLRAGDAVRAETSLRAALERDPTRHRWAGYLADALAAQGRTGPARIAYRERFARAPRDIDVAAIVDADVRSLLDLAEVDYELPGDPVEWVAAVGVIEGVFLPPEGWTDEWFTEASLASVAPGVRFYRWMVREIAARDDDERVVCRRAMRALNPALQAIVLGKRRVGR